MKWLAVLLTVATAACGVDGPPQRPAPKTGSAAAPTTVPQSHISISGDARIGVMTEL